MQDLATLQREASARYCVEQIQDGMRVGLGTGRAATIAVKMVAERVRAGLDISAIPTSEATRVLAIQEGIPLIGFDCATELDLTIDGADEVAPGLALIKGGGGALLHEKIVASISKRMLVVAESAKLVRTLGKFPLPVEVVPFGWEVVRQKLTDIGGAPVLRQKKDESGTYVTDEGNYILDCHFDAISNPVQLSAELKSYVGVVEHGLFVNIATEAVIGQSPEVLILKRDSAVDMWP